MSLLDNHHYDKYTHFEVELINWGYKPRRKEQFSRTRTLCRKHLRSLETKIERRNIRRGIDSLESRVGTLFPDDPCYICGSERDNEFKHLPKE